MALLTENEQFHLKIKMAMSEDTLFFPVTPAEFRL